MVTLRAPGFSFQCPRWAFLAFAASLGDDHLVDEALEAQEVEFVQFGAFAKSATDADGERGEVAVAGEIGNGEARALNGGRKRGFEDGADGVFAGGDAFVPGALEVCVVGQYGEGTVYVVGADAFEEFVNSVGENTLADGRHQVWDKMALKKGGAGHGVAQLVGCLAPARLIWGVWVDPNCAGSGAIAQLLIKGRLSVTLAAAAWTGSLLQTFRLIVF